MPRPAVTARTYTLPLMLYVDEQTFDQLEKFCFEHRVKKSRIIRDLLMEFFKEPRPLESTTDPANRYKSNYAGIDWDKKDQRWRLRKSINGVQRQLGTYKSEAEAIRALEKFESERGENSNGRG